VSRHNWIGAIALAMLSAAAACSPPEPPANADASETRPVTPPTEAQLVDALAAADVVYLGERHDSLDEHIGQLEIIDSLHARDPNLAIAMEMFQRPFQPAIDRYLAGEISEADLVEQTEYERRWGFPWELYAPFLRYAKEKGIPAIAANAPTEITRRVAREGLDSLDGDDFRYIPPREAIATDNEAYRAFVRQAFGAHGSHGDLNFENFFAAQVVWDETMAERIAAFKQANPDTLVVVLAGRGHVIYGYGIPDRVARRLGEETVQHIVLLNPDEALAGEGVGEIADFFWYTQE